LRGAKDMAMTRSAVVLATAILAGVGARGPVNGAHASPGSGEAWVSRYDGPVSGADNANAVVASL